ncbi:uncharacterized protein K452DRAFT_291853 [Aplosporella prunicola CBS 121167]|uniref:Carboxylic ester hydrolase n=1 Tax=Aplosporella prunicola CBS 121167 TaxID=1176127 RepID=A0A6A6B2V9_9PEZI|nr:uncharacterized protein K452DRAFT_291853 [Aplosporella prunicola CBS 121167]KAF2137061.1 hypothetical protein K452DRAFT_291853 [Aplosporella prunicola CBS 121167]
MFLRRFVGSIAGATLLCAPAAAADTTANCNPATFMNISLPGGAVLDTIADPIYNLPTVPTENALVPPLPSPPETISFCNVTVLYTHPGQNDTITVTIWLPLEGWNSRLIGVGGGGFLTRLLDDALGSALQHNYSVVATDGGHALDADPAPWALTSPGNVNWALLQDFAAVSLGDAAVLGKAVSEAYYAQKPAYSYFSGCSTGGRQGIMLAQRYPSAYDGILAGAPAVHMATLVPAMFYPVTLMHDLGTAPPQCVLDAITAAAVAACDGLDGTADGIIAGPCDFDAHDVVGQHVACGAFNATVTAAAAEVANAVWAGAKAEDASPLWYGLNRGAPLSGIANTTCDASGTACAPVPFNVAEGWLRYFVLRDPSSQPLNLTRNDLAPLIRASNNVYASVISAADPDLTDFKAAGGKLLSWHGMDDQLIPVRGSEVYYRDVLERDAGAAAYFRLFEVPGVWHCHGGKGPLPLEAFDRLVGWVERGEVPEVLRGVTRDERTNASRVWELPAWGLDGGDGDDDYEGKRREGVRVLA